MSSSTPGSPRRAVSTAGRTKTKRRKPPKSPDGTMSLSDHIRELRTRVIISLIAFSIGTVVGFAWFQVSVGPIQSLGEILRGPYCSVDPDLRADFTMRDECRLLVTSPFEMFLLRMKVGALAGAVLASPVWLYQLWAFVTPGLKKNERKWTVTFVVLAVTLFIVGACLAYFIVDIGLEFLITMASDVAVAGLNAHSYFRFLLALVLIFGISFEVPLILGLLNIMGVVSYDQLKDKRRIIIVLLFIFAAVMTPGQDPFSMVVLALSLILLVEGALQFTRFNDKRRKKQRPDWMDVDDEHASTLSTQPGGVDAPQPIADPSATAQVRPTAPTAPVHNAGPISQLGGVAQPHPIAQPGQVTPSQLGNQEPSSSYGSAPSSHFDDVL
ncbi:MULTISPECIES: twin-arginine translocase subunit TatC [Corynebacterium]|uniref:twin-arginine translocase subunit TatC n=1 Tax=Corynebacterium TaxID=1716 RepID=UPI00124CEC29